MNRNMTIGDFVQESMVYEYSREYFDLMKEAGEVELMGIYLAASIVTGKQIGRAHV